MKLCYRCSRTLYRCQCADTEDRMPAVGEEAEVEKKFPCVVWEDGDVRIVQLKADPGLPLHVNEEVCDAYEVETAETSDAMGQKNWTAEEGLDLRYLAAALARMAHRSLP